MDSVVKWIGGGTLSVVLAIGAAIAANSRASFGAEDVRIEPAQVIETSQPNVTTLTAKASTPAKTAKPEAPAPAAGPFVIKRVLPIEGPIKYGEWHWDDAGVPDGPLLMTVDLDARVLSVFKDGYEIGATAVLLGTDEYPTPLGTFPILSKERHNVSEKYNNAPMPWTMRLTRDGVAIHGGSTVELGYASHGCIGAPDDFVRKLFAVAKVGDKVIITRGKMVGLGDSLAGG